MVKIVLLTQPLQNHPDSLVATVIYLYASCHRYLYINKYMYIFYFTLFTQMVPYSTY